MRTGKKAGFTLIELLVAMTIIAVLAGLGLVSYQGARKSARDGRRKSDLEEIRSALEMYRSDENEYPDAGLGGLGDYIDLPKDPVSGDDYHYSGTENTYELCATLEIPGTDSCSGCATCNYKTTNP